MNRIGTSYEPDRVTKMEKKTAGFGIEKAVTPTFELTEVDLVKCDLDMTGVVTN